MAYYALLYEAGDDFVQRRTPFREEHLGMAREAHARGELVLAGALGDPVNRALLVFRGESPDAARTFAQNDPYVRNGLVKRWEVSPWMVVVGGDATPNAAAARGEL
jgi:uncharacterized protein YciI